MKFNYNLLITTTLFSLLLISDPLLASHQNAKEQAKQAVKDAGASAYHAKEAVKEEAKGGGESIMDKAKNIGSRIMNSFHSEEDCSSEFPEGYSIRKVYDKAGKLVENAREYAGDLYDESGNAIEEKTRGFGQRVADTVSGIKRSLSGSVESAKDLGESLYDQAGNAIDNAREYAGDLYDEAGNLVHSGSGKFYDKSGKLVDNIRDYTGELYDKAGNLMDRTRHKAKAAAKEGTAAGIGQKIKNVVSGIKDTIGGKISGSGQGIRDLGETLYDKSGNAVDNVKDYAEDLYDRAGNLVYSGKEKFYDRSGNVIENVRDYTGNLYNKAGNMIDMVRFNVQEKAEELNDKVKQKTGMNLKEPRWSIRKVYDKAGNAVENARDYAGDLYDKAGKMIANARDSVLDAGSNARHSAEDAAESFYDRAGNLIENSKDYAGDMYDRAGNLAWSAKETFYDRAGNVVHNIREYTGFLYNKAGNLVEFGCNTSARARDAIKDKAEQAKEYVEEKWEGQETLSRKASKTLHHAKDSLIDRVERLFGGLFRLILTLGSLILCGYLALFFLNKRNREDATQKVKGLAGDAKAGAAKAKERLASAGAKAMDRLDKTTSRIKGAAHDNSDGDLNKHVSMNYANERRDGDEVIEEEEEHHSKTQVHRNSNGTSHGANKAHNKNK